MLAVAVDDVRSFHFRRTEVALVTLDDVTQLVAQYFVQIKAQENRGQHVKLILKYGRFSKAYYFCASKRTAAIVLDQMVAKASDGQRNPVPQS